MSTLRRAGFTLFEVMIALALIGLVVTKVAMVMEEARRAHEQESVSMALEDQALELIDKIAYALYGADAETLDPIMAPPFPTSKVNFHVSLGVEDGLPVWGDPEVIGLTEDGRQLFWGQNVGEGDERMVVWANSVSAMLQDELMNGIDDNGNELADELGLTFVMDQRSVTIRLTLERMHDDGKKVQATKETTVTCRN